MANRYLLAVILAITIMSVGAPSHSSECVDDCVPIGEWQVNIGVGLGWRGNPLHDGDDSPMFVLPQIRYYGKRFFLENMELGWTLMENPNHQVNLLVTPSSDQMHFNRWDPYNLFDSNGAGGAPGGNFGVAGASPVNVEFAVPQGSLNTPDPSIPLGAEGGEDSSSGFDSVVTRFDNVEAVSINGSAVSLAESPPSRAPEDGLGTVLLEGISEGDIIELQLNDGELQETRVYTVQDGELTDITSADSVGIVGPRGSDKVSVEDVKTRKMAVLGGLEYLYSSERFELHSQLLSDISGVHEGHEWRAAAILPWQGLASRWAVTLGVSYKSEEILDYYYGLRAEDNVSSELLYQPASAGIASMVRLDWQKPLSKRWSLRSMLQHTRLPNEVHDSPLVSQKSVTSFFFGGVYHF